MLCAAKGQSLELAREWQQLEEARRKLRADMETVNSLTPLKPVASLHIELGEVGGEGVADRVNGRPQSSTAMALKWQVGFWFLYVVNYPVGM